MENEWTKEAIKKVRNIITSCIDYMPFTDKKLSNVIKLVEGEEEIISLLQKYEEDSKELKITKKELKKVWKMWEEVMRILNLTSHLLSGDDIRKEMEKIEQKYFLPQFISTSFQLAIRGKNDDVHEFYRRVDKLEDFMRDKNMAFTIEWGE